MNLPEVYNPSIEDRLREMDPVRLLRMYAEGDVVGLGLLSQEEYDADEVYDLDGNIIEPSGKVKALNLIPPKMRADILKDLLQYLHAKKSKDDAGPVSKNPVSFYIPANGRDQKKITIRDAEVVDE